MMHLTNQLWSKGPFLGLVLLAFWATSGHSLSAAAPRPPSQSTVVVAPVVAASSVKTTVFAGFFTSIMGNRSRMIQTALVIVALGIFVLHRK